MNLINLYLLKEYKINENINKIFIGEKENRTCRFCNKSKDDGATFKKKAHAIPQLTGNNRVFSNEECDKCNEKFGYLENDLGMYLLPIRAIYDISGKRKNKCKNGSLDILNENKQLILKDIIDEDGKPEYTNFKKNSNEMVLKIKRSGFRKSNVFKSMVKMALSIIPTNVFNRLEIYKDLLDSKCDIIPNMIIKETFIPGMNKNNKLVIRYGILRDNILNVKGELPLVIFTIRLCGYQYCINLYEKNFSAYKFIRIDISPELDFFHYKKGLKHISYGWESFENNMMEENKYMYMTMKYEERKIISNPSNIDINKF